MARAEIRGSKIATAKMASNAFDVYTSAVRIGTRAGTGCHCSAKSAKIKPTMAMRSVPAA